MRHYIAAVGLVGLLLMGFTAVEVSAQGFVYGGPMVFENTPFVNVGISGEKRVFDGVKVAFVIVVILGYSRLTPRGWGSR